MSKIPERTDKYKQGLRDMILWMNKFYPVQKMKIIEVGSWNGCSSIIFAEYFNKVICIDLWKSNIGGITNKYDMRKVERIFDKRAEEYKGIIFKNKISSLEAAEIYSIESDIKPDVVYIDADHEYKNNKQDIIVWKKIPSKFLCGHDYEHRFPGVIKAVDELLGKPHKIFQDSSWIFKLN